MLDDIKQWLEQNPEFLDVLGWVSIGGLIVGVFLSPWLVSKLPVDYFRSAELGDEDEKPDRSLRGLLLAIVRNVLGCVFVLAGIAMVVLPGPGLATILLGVLLMDFPGKSKLVRYIASRPGVIDGLNWMRKKAGAPPLDAP